MLIVRDLTGHLRRGAYLPVSQQLLRRCYQSNVGPWLWWWFVFKQHRGAVADDRGA
jgi:hypothetical protein